MKSIRRAQLSDLQLHCVERCPRGDCCRSSNGRENGQPTFSKPMSHQCGRGVRNRGSSVSYIQGNARLPEDSVNPCLGAGSRTPDWIPLRQEFVTGELTRAPSARRRSLALSSPRAPTKIPSTAIQVFSHGEARPRPNIPEIRPWRSNNCEQRQPRMRRACGSPADTKPGNSQHLTYCAEGDPRLPENSVNPCLVNVGQIVVSRLNFQFRGVVPPFPVRPEGGRDSYSSSDPSFAL
jgi:hypothetical protein